MLHIAAKQEFTQAAQAFGAKSYFVAPEAYPQYEGNSKGIGFDPFAQLPTVRCVIVLVWAYVPVQSPAPPQLSAYYLASHRGYKAANELSKWLSNHGATVAFADLPVRAVLERAKIAAIGKNGLAAMQDIGSYFYAKLLLTDAFEPDEIRDTQNSCVQCGRCEKACPVGAICETFDPSRCIRQHLDGRSIPENVKQSMVSTLGCELCQRVCPRNRAIVPIAPSTEISDLFSFESLIARYPKSTLAQVIGKNMVGGGRLQSHALVLAAKAGNGAFIEDAQKLCASEHECLRDAALWYLNHFQKQESEMKGSPH